LKKEVRVARLISTPWPHVLTAALIAAAPASVSAGAAEDGPAKLIHAFAEICLADGSLDPEENRRRALAAGWSPQAARVISTSTGKRIDKTGTGPRFFRKADLTLSLLDQGRGEQACSVVATLERPITAKRLALDLTGGLIPDDADFISEGPSERAVWQAKQGRIEAAAGRENSLQHAKLTIRRWTPGIDVAALIAAGE
jgi:hypothetical protein